MKRATDMRISKIILSLVGLTVCFASQLLAYGSYYVGTSPSSCVEHITAPIFDGGFEMGGSWLYLQPISTDGDLEIGTLLTLTLDPANLTAHMQELTPDYRSSYRGNIGYSFPCTNCSMMVDYFHFGSKDKDNVDNLRGNQFIQNFLGGSFITAEASEKQRLDQVDLTVSNQFIVDGCFNINPFIGVSYSRIKRNFDVEFTGFNGNVNSANLPGYERSSYWGVGPVAGFNFCYPLFCSLSFEGRFGGGALIGNIDSSVNSHFQRGEVLENFDETSCYHRVVPFLNTGLEVAYTYARPGDCIGFKLSVGYEVDYYFNAVDRINPFNGYVNNSSTFPVKTSSNLGLGGPYVYLSLIDNPVHRESKLITDYVSSTCRPPCGLFGGMINSWLEASPSNRDLDYAILHTIEKKDKYLHASPSHTWSGTYYVGYRLPCNIDFRAQYFHYDATAKTSTKADTDQEISSLNASGLSTVSFGSATSRINYDLNQFDVIAGKYIQPCRQLNLYTFVGMRYADLDRTQHNGYFDGVPPETTETKTPRLKSMMSGIGPVFGIDPQFSYCGNFGVAAHLDVALLVGSVRSTLDQINEGDQGSSSNILRIRNTQWIIPVVDLKGGIFYTCSFNNCFSMKIELGYQFSEYYRSINQVFPTLLTGLEQTNSDFKLSGPYIAVDIFGY
jgi:Legionella pneumophila major outer membrane protein precursor